MRLAILNEINEAEVVTDYGTWAAWFESHPDKRQIGIEKFSPTIYVSTVFLGNSIEPENQEPRFFETRVFGLDYEAEEMMRRYLSYDAAVRGHGEVVELVRALLADRVDDALENAERFPPTHRPGYSD